jgi:hypothetical protein
MGEDFREVSLGGPGVTTFTRVFGVIRLIKETKDIGFEGL